MQSVSSESSDSGDFGVSGPKLQPPGAGLPWPQILLIRLWLGPVVSKRTPLAECRKRYELLTRKIVERAGKVPPELRNMKILVDPIPGLEDSSRYWSLNGVLEHLLIVSRGIEPVILSLSSGRVPEGKADTAAVKPGQFGQDFLAEFADYAPGLLARLDAKLAQPGMNLNSPARFRHPWFGGLNARQWYWLLSSHQGIHSRQAREIARKL